LFKLFIGKRPGGPGGVPDYFGDSIVLSRPRRLDVSREQDGDDGSSRQGPGAPGGSSEQDKTDYTDNSIIVRTDFPETWIWEDIMNNNCDAVKFSKKVPDTITSWLISAFSLNQANGLGLNENPTSLTVFRPFFISTTLPYSVKRGERLTLSIQIFNYLSSDQDVSVTMSNAGQQFDFTDDTDAIYGRFYKIIRVQFLETISKFKYSHLIISGPIHFRRCLFFFVSLCFITKTR
jgi:Alpha-2-macroglobulin family